MPVPRTGHTGTSETAVRWPRDGRRCVAERRAHPAFAQHVRRAHRRCLEHRPFRKHAARPVSGARIRSSTRVPPGRARDGRWPSSSIRQLRWIRTSLLGRMRPWCPPVAPVGPWRPIAVETAPIRIEIRHVDAVSMAATASSGCGCECESPRARRAPDRRSLEARCRSMELAPGSSPSRLRMMSSR